MFIFNVDVTGHLRLQLILAGARAHSQSKFDLPSLPFPSSHIPVPSLSSRVLALINYCVGRSIDKQGQRDWCRSFHPIEVCFCPFTQRESTFISGESLYTPGWVYRIRTCLPRCYSRFRNVKEYQPRSWNSERTISYSTPLACVAQALGTNTANHTKIQAGHSKGKPT